MRDTLWRHRRVNADIIYRVVADDDTTVYYAVDGTKEISDAPKPIWLRHYEQLSADDVLERYPIL